MKLRRQYLSIWQALRPAAAGSFFELTIDELAAFVECTARNMVLLLHKMEKLHWLRWQPKKGRGNRSSLQLLADGGMLAMEEAQETVSRQSLQAALEWVQGLNASLPIQKPFQQWLQGQFGFHSIMQGQQRTDMLRFPLPQRIRSLDPAQLHYSGEAHLVTQLFDGLARMDSANYSVQPHLALGWEIHSDRTEWTFYLRKGVLFHHGRELVASDVRYTFERLQQLAPQGLFNWSYMNIAAIRVLDDRTLQFQLKRPDETFLSFLTTNRASIVPKDDCERKGAAFGFYPAGTGPFKLTHKENQVWKLDAFSPYFLGRPFLDRVEVWEMPDGEPTERFEEEPADRCKGASEKRPDGRERAAETPGATSGREYAAEAPDAGLSSSAFQIMHNVRIHDMAAEQWQQIQQSGMTCKFLTVNEAKDGPLSAHPARQLLHEAIERERLLNLLSGDAISLCNSFWNEAGRPQKNVPGLHQPVPGKQPETDERFIPNKQPVPDEQLVPGERQKRQNGPVGRDICLTLATITQYERDAGLIRMLCEQAGIRLTVQLLTAEQFKGHARMSADLFLFAMMLDEHRELRVIDLFRSMQQHMLPESSNAMELALQEVLKEQSAPARSRKLQAIEQGLIERRQLLFLYRKHLKTAFHPSIRGISLESLSWVQFRDIWFTAEQGEH